MDLDPPGGRWAVDPQGVLATIQGKAQQMRDGYGAGRGSAGDRLRVRGLLFAGMGGSGISADLVRDACTRALDVPFTVVKHYQFPQHVKPDWHCLAVSYSGDTEETLSVAREAKRRGVPVTGFTTGGALAKVADRVVPQAPGHQPRFAVGYAWASILGFLEGSGLLREAVPLDDAVAAVQEVDATCGPHVPEADNEAKQLARILWERIPQIYATPSFYGVGLFLRAMLNENAKKIADVDLVPEANHNDFTGWGSDPNREHFTILALSHAHQNPEILKRLRFMESRYKGWGLPWHHHVFAGVDDFPQHIVEQARGVQMMDYAAFYTAMLRGVDPAEVEEIVALKEYLRG